MSKTWSLTEAFDYFGAKGTNQRWNWSARSDDGKIVVLALWKDVFDYKNKPASYDTFDLNTEAWSDTNGNRERLQQLIWARDNCDGLFRVVIAIAKDVKA